MFHLFGSHWKASFPRTLLSRRIFFRTLFIHPLEIVATVWSPGTKVSLPQIPTMNHLEPLGSFEALLATRIQSCNICNKYRYENISTFYIQTTDIEINQCDVSCTVVWNSKLVRQLGVVYKFKSFPLIRGNCESYQTCCVIFRVSRNFGSILQMK